MLNKRSIPKESPCSYSGPQDLKLDPVAKNDTITKEFISNVSLENCIREYFGKNMGNGIHIYILLCK